MKRIAILTRSYANLRSANAICASNIVNEFIKSGNSVSIISYEPKIIQESLNPNVNMVFKRRETNKQYSLINRLYSVYNLCLCRPDTLIDLEVVNMLYSKLCELHGKAPFDLVVAFYFPLESAQVIKQFKAKYPEVKTVLYELDSATDGATQSHLKLLYEKTVNRWICGIYSIVDSIIIMQSHKDYWIKTFSDFDNKMHVADIPVLVFRQYNPQRNVEPFVFIYSGLLDKKYRSPNFLLSVMKLLRSSIDFDIYFYSKGNCEKDIELQGKEFRWIHQMGYVSSEQLNEALCNASVLISIGNAESKSVPSKLINYISYRKPIIHFSHQSNDVCDLYLRRYPYALVVSDELQVEDACKKIQLFMRSINDISFDDENLMKKYYMNDPQFSTSKILE